MEYFPKNKIKTGLYTSGDEYTLIEDNKNYIGKYWSTSSGKLFTGLGPTDKPYFELSPLKKVPKNNQKSTTTPTISNVIFSENMNYKINEVFNYINITDNIVENISIPTPFYPQPTESDYKLGEFQRYFCVKSNELKYTEVNKEQYTKFKNKDNSVSWQYYTSFSLPWDISGDKEKVYQTNKNIVLITEQNIKRRGLQEFLRKNYLKFYLVS
jgi:hypothetical protein